MSIADSTTVGPVFQSAMIVMSEAFTIWFLLDCREICAVYEKRIEKIFKSESRENMRAVTHLTHVADHCQHSHLHLASTRCPAADLMAAS